MRGRFDAGGTQEGIEQVKEGVAAAPKPRVHLLAESSELFQLRSVHNRKDELSSLFLSTPDSVTLCCWLKCKLRGAGVVGLYGSSYTAVTAQGGCEGHTGAECAEAACRASNVQ